MVLGYFDISEPCFQNMKKEKIWKSVALGRPPLDFRVNIKNKDIESIGILRYSFKENNLYWELSDGTQILFKEIKYWTEISNNLMRNFIMDKNTKE